MNKDQTQASEVNSLIQKAVGSGNGVAETRSKIQDLLHLDDLNWNYFFYLYEGKMGGAKPKALQIFEEGKAADGKSVAYPVAIAPEGLRKSLRQVEYVDLVHSERDYSTAAKNVCLWVKKMQAGSGSSMTRTSYIQKVKGISERDVKIGAKGTDLFVEVPDPKNRKEKATISIAEAQLLQSIGELERKEIGEIVFHDIVSSETEASLKALWDKPSLIDSKKTYRQIVQEGKGSQYFGKTFQSFIPTLDEEGKISFNRKAPGGHALFAVDALRAAYRKELRPKSEKTLIASISNGEDLSSAPDRFMVGYMAKERIPIVLVTTERTAVDLKGGLVSLLKDDEGAVSLTVVETAQAKEAGQENLFASLPGIVSTNLTLFNYEVLTPLLTQEVQEIGEDEFMKVISPDLISNTKMQVDADGVKRKYLQLEGAMGSTIMRLDRYWRKKYSTPLVHLINVDRKHRTDFFSPIKSAFDYFMQFHSDRFYFDAELMKLKNLRPGELPEVSLLDPATQNAFYQDVENVLDCFEGVSIKDLNRLSIFGQVNLKGMTLRGKVELINHGNSMPGISSLLQAQGRKPVLENQSVEITQDGQVLLKAI